MTDSSNVFDRNAGSGNAAVDPFEELSRLINTPAPTVPPMGSGQAVEAHDFVVHAPIETVAPAPAMPTFDPPAADPADSLADHLAAELERGFALTPPEPAPILPVASVPETEEPEIVVPFEIAPAAASVEPVELDIDFSDSLAGEFEEALRADLEAAAAIETHVTSAPVIASLDFAPEASEPVQHEAAAMVPPVVAAPLAARPAGGSKRWIGAIAAVGVMGLGSAAAYTMFVPGSPDEAPLVVAAKTPVKVRPVDQGGETVMNADTAVFAGREAAPQERLVGTEKPAVRTAAAEPKPRRSAAIPARKVRTVVVKPDGTIIMANAATNDATVVGSVERKPAPAPKPVEVAALSTPKAPSIDEQLATIKTPPANRPQVAALRTEAAAPARVVKAAPVEKAVEPEAPKPAAEATPKPSGYVVQIASQRSQDAAEKSWANVKRRYGKIIGPRGVDYQVREISGKGTYYRVRVLASSKSDANSVCSKLKRAGGDCFVTR